MTKIKKNKADKCDVCKELVDECVCNRMASGCGCGMCWFGEMCWCGVCWWEDDIKKNGKC